MSVLKFQKEMAGTIVSSYIDYNLNYSNDGQIKFMGVSIETFGQKYAYTLILTGWYYYDSTKDRILYQTTSGGFVQNGEFEYTGLDEKAKNNAQSIINKIIKNNQKILEHNLFCARFANKLTDDERQRLFNLQNRLEERNNALLNKELIQQAYTSYPAGYANEASYLDKFMKNGGKVGVVLSTTAVIVVSAVVVASLSAAAYFAYQAFYNESEDDVKYSEELTQTLMAKLTPEEWEQLKNETQGIVTKARIKQSLGTSSSIIGIIGWGFAAFAAYKFIMPFFEKNKNKKNDGKV